MSDDFLSASGDEGTAPYPDLTADYLERAPALCVDLSVHDERIAPKGILRNNWYELFAREPGRFMVGVDRIACSAYTPLMKPWQGRADGYGSCPPISPGGWLMAMPQPCSISLELKWLGTEGSGIDHNVKLAKK